MQMIDYILPTDTHSASGGQPAHVAIDKHPVCGAPMPATFIESGWLLSWNLCERCKRLTTGEMVQAILLTETNPT